MTTAATADLPTPANAWTATERIAFRFAVAYWVIYQFVWFPNRQLGFVGSEGWTALGMPVLAAVIALLWSAFTTRTEYARGHEVLRVYLRYSLAIWMLTYATVKFGEAQFAFPGLDFLATPYGSLTPYSLLDTFMGYSYPYTVFAGVGELVGSLLLFSRRTTTLGALVMIAVLSNVVVLNFAYDWPVGYFALELMLAAVFLLVPDLRRLANALYFQRPVPAVVLAAPRWNQGRKRTARRWIKRATITLSVAVSVAMVVIGNWYFSPKPSPLTGAYNVESFVRNHETIPPLATDSTRWRTIIVPYAQVMNVLTMTRLVRAYLPDVDTVQRRLTLTFLPQGRAGSPPDTSVRFVFAYERQTPDRLTLRGTIFGDSVEMRLRRIDEHEWRLVRRGFHWLSAQPVDPVKAVNQ